jgi:TRAP-type C4-dicarboxylate transport system substrate-binding protein
MRVIAEIPHSQCKIAIFYMNGKYMVQFTFGHFEQIFKISELDYIIKDIEDIKKIINDDFVSEVIARFKNMNEQLNIALVDF